MKNLKQKALQGGLAKVCSQGIGFIVRVGSLMIMARLLDPKDFGLVGMVTAVIGVFSVFRDFGLSAAAVQRTHVTTDQASTLFWINLAVGATLGLLSLAIAPLLAFFYHEPRLLGVTAALATGFLFNAAGAQHSAMLERQMRFTALSVIDIVALLTGTLTGVAMAIRGYGYWALVAATTISTLASTLCVWVATVWVPGKPRTGIGMRSMMRFGGTLTLNSLVMYITTNSDKVLLGRFLGSDALGIYGRAYQLVNIPTDNLNSATSGVAFATLSRLKDNPGRFKSYFLKGYALVLSLTVPIVVVCALFAADMISVFLGAKWASAIPIFRLLTPAVLAFALINPMGWLLMSLGLVDRGLRMALVLAPVMITGYSIGLPYGPRGVACAYSTLMMLCVLPLITWAVRGTVISVRDVVQVASRPLLSGFVAAGSALGLQIILAPRMSPLLGLVGGVTLVLAVYLGMLLYVLGQKSFYLETLRGFKNSSSVDEELVVSA